MASISEEIKKSKKKLQKIQEQIRELKATRSKTGLNSQQKMILLNFDTGQKKIIEHIGKLHVIQFIRSLLN